MLLNYFIEMEKSQSETYQKNRFSFLIELMTLGGLSLLQPAPTKRNNVEADR